MSLPYAALGAGYGDGERDGRVVGRRLGGRGFLLRRFFGKKIGEARDYFRRYGSDENEDREEADVLPVRAFFTASLMPREL